MCRTILLRRTSPRMLTYDNARDTVLIGAYLGIEALLCEQFPSRFDRVAIAFDPGHAIFREPRRQFRRDATDERKAIGARAKRELRLPVRHALRKSALVGYVGWVRRYDVELCVSWEGGKKVADADIGARGVKAIFTYVFFDSRLVRRIEFAEIHLGVR